MVQYECKHCKRFSAPINDRCRYCGRKMTNRSFEWAIIVAFVVMLIALGRVILFP